jgi:hypothetical protein
MKVSSLNIVYDPFGAIFRPGGGDHRVQQQDYLAELARDARQESDIVAGKVEPVRAAGNS